MNLIAHINNQEHYSKFKFRLEVCNKELRLYQDELDRTPTTDENWRQYLERRIAKRTKLKNQLLFGKEMDLEDLKL